MPCQAGSDTEQTPDAACKLTLQDGWRVVHPPAIVIEQGSGTLSPQAHQGEEGSSGSAHPLLMQHHLASCSGCHLPCLDDDDALVPSSYCPKDFLLHGQRVKGYLPLAVFVLHLVQSAEPRGVTYQSCDLGVQLEGDAGGDVDAHDAPPKRVTCTDGFHAGA